MNNFIDTVDAMNDVTSLLERFLSGCTFRHLENLKSENYCEKGCNSHKTCLAFRFTAGKYFFGISKSYFLNDF